MFIAASLFAMAIFFVVMNFSGSATKEELFVEYFEPYEAPSAISETPKWNAVVNSYTRNDFELALQQLEQVESSIHFTWVEFYKGMCYMQLEHPDYYDAAYYLNEVRLETSDYKEQANWYYALVMLIQGRQKEAKTIFSDIKKTKAFNYRKAESILNTKIEN